MNRIAKQQEAIYGKGGIF
jgi:hypothetical protein